MPVELSAAFCCGLIEAWQAAAPLPPRTCHEDAATHEQAPEKRWDLIISLDDATSEQYSMFFVEEEGTASGFQAMREVITAKGLPSSLYTDRGSHYWHTPRTGGKAGKQNLTQFGHAMAQLGRDDPGLLSRGPGTL